MNATFTHYHLQVRRPGEIFPERGEIADWVVLDIANHGTTPERVSPELKDRAAKILAALLAGHHVETATADVWPLTEADYKAGRITPAAVCVRI